MAGDRSMSVFRSFGCFFFFNDTATTEIYTYGPLFPYTTLFRSFLVDGAAVVLTAPAPAASTGPKRTASGSFAVDDARARVARPSRILVEGRHDAELVEKVWGDDLRVEGVVVEYLQGVDLLADLLAAEPPTAPRPYGVPVAHLVERQSVG